jgi:hypothetical protein
VSAEEATSHSRIYQFYDWGHRPFEITLQVLEGNATLLYQRTGQEDVTQNIYTAVPLTRNNSHAAYNVSAGKYRQINVDGSNCFACWHFVRVDVLGGNATRYAFSVAERGSGAQFDDLALGRTTQVTLRGGPVTRRFLLDSMDDWVLSAVVATGGAEIFVGFDPDTVDKGGHAWSGSTAAGRDIRIAVKTTDSQFHLATYYYVYIKQTSSRDARIKLSLTQERSVDFLGNNHDYTYTLKHPVFSHWGMM